MNYIVHERIQAVCFGGNALIGWKRFVAVFTLRFVTKNPATVFPECWDRRKQKMHTSSDFVKNLQNLTLQKMNNNNNTEKHSRDQFGTISLGHSIKSDVASDLVETEGSMDNSHKARPDMAGLDRGLLPNTNVHGRPQALSQDAARSAIDAPVGTETPMLSTIGSRAAKESAGNQIQPGSVGSHPPSHPRVLTSGSIMLGGYDPNHRKAEEIFESGTPDSLFASVKTVHQGNGSHPESIPRTSTVGGSDTLPHSTKYTQPMLEPKVLLSPHYEVPTSSIIPSTIDRGGSSSNSPPPQKAALRDDLGIHRTPSESTPSGATPKGGTHIPQHPSSSSPSPEKSGHPDNGLGEQGSHRIGRSSLVSDGSLASVISPAEPTRLSSTDQSKAVPSANYDRHPTQESAKGGSSASSGSLNSHTPSEGIPPQDGGEGTQPDSVPVGGDNRDTPLSETPSAPVSPSGSKIQIPSCGEGRPSSAQSVPTFEKDSPKGLNSSPAEAAREIEALNSEVRKTPSPPTAMSVSYASGDTPSNRTQLPLEALSNDSEERSTEKDTPDSTAPQTVALLPRGTKSNPDTPPPPAASVGSVPDPAGAKAPASSSTQASPTPVGAPPEVLVLRHLSRGRRALLMEFLRSLPPVRLKRCQNQLPREANRSRIRRPQELH